MNRRRRDGGGPPAEPAGRDTAEGFPETASSVLGLIRDDGPAALGEEPSEGTLPLEEAAAEPGSEPARPPAAARAGPAAVPRSIRVSLGALWILMVAFVLAAATAALWAVDVLRTIEGRIEAAEARLETIPAADPGLQPRLERLERRLDAMAGRLDVVASSAVSKGQWEEAMALLREMTNQRTDAPSGAATPAAAPASGDEAVLPESENTAGPAPRASAGDVATPQPRFGTPQRSENWAVNLITVAGAGRAREYRERYAAQGIRARTEVFEKGGRTLYRLYVDGYPDRATALREGARLKESLGLDELWVTRVTPKEGNEKGR